MPITIRLLASGRCWTNGYIRVAQPKRSHRLQGSEPRVELHPLPDAATRAARPAAAVAAAAACGCNSVAAATTCGLGFSMYGSCGVRYFHVDDDLAYATESSRNVSIRRLTAPATLTSCSNGIQVKNDLIGPQVGWTSDYCWGKWNLFCNTRSASSTTTRAFGNGCWTTTATTPPTARRRRTERPVEQRLGRLPRRIASRYGLRLQLPLARCDRLPGRGGHRRGDWFRSVVEPEHRPATAPASSTPTTP